MIFQLMKKADLHYAQEPDIYIANSTTVAQRIEKIYGSPAVTVNYPIDVSKFVFSDQKEDFYLASARLLSYKRIDIIVEAFKELGWPLIVSGDGPERARLEEIASKNIEFIGYVSDEERSQLFTRAQSVIVAALEDYGLVPVEANASGTPVISYGAGGVLDTQVAGLTGLFFKEQTAESLRDALLKARNIQWDYAKIRTHAMQRFTENVFFEQTEKIVNQVCGRQVTELAC